MCAVLYSVTGSDLKDKVVVHNDWAWLSACVALNLQLSPTDAARSDAYVHSVYFVLKGLVFFAFDRRRESLTKGGESSASYITEVRSLTSFIFHQPNEKQH